MTGFWELFFSSLGGTATAIALFGFLGKAFLESRLKKDQQDYTSQLRRAESIESVVNQYSRVIMLSAEDAQDRLWHVCEMQAKSKNKVLEAKDDLQPMYGAWPMTRKHYLHSSLYLLAKYLCWVEIVRERVQLLEFNDNEKTTQFNYHLKRIERAFSETSLQAFASSKISTDKPLFSLMQQEIGECLRTPGKSEYACIGFLAFQQQYAQMRASSEALVRLEDLLHGSMSESKSNFCLRRLKIACNALTDLTRFLHQYNNLSASEPLEKIAVPDFDNEAYLRIWPSVKS